MTTKLPITCYVHAHDTCLVVKHTQHIVYPTESQELDHVAPIMSSNVYIAPFLLFTPLLYVILRRQEIR